MERKPSGQFFKVVDDPAGGVDVHFQEVHDPFILLGAFHEFQQRNLTCRTSQQPSDVRQNQQNLLIIDIETHIIKTVVSQEMVLVQLEKRV